jgi:hypothetical protein
MKRTVLILIATTGIALTLALPVQGQTTGRLRGTVVDLDGLAMPAVTVTVKSSVLMGGSRIAVTGDTGAYRFTALPPGIYSATADLEGFQSSSHEGVTVGINTTADVDFVLYPAEFSEEMTVTGEAPLVDVTGSSVSTNFTSKFIQDLPTNRAYYSLMAVAPGVAIGFDDAAGHLNAFGSDMGSNAWYTDGIEVSSPEAGSNWMWLNFDTVEEIQVMGVGAPAEFGNMRGAALNVVTKSGSNELKGLLNAYWFDNSLVDSDINFDESEFSEFEQVHPFWDVSATLGGAIKRDCLWFFVGYEYFQDGAAYPGQDPAASALQSMNTYDLKLSAQLNQQNLLDFRGGLRNDEWPYPPDEFTTLSAAPVWLGDGALWALNYQSIFSDRTFLEARYSGWKAGADLISQTRSTDPALIDYAPPDGGPTRYAGGLWWPFLNETSSDQATATISHFADDLLAGDHDFKFGVQISRGDTISRVSPSAAGVYYAHYYNEPDHSYYKVEGSPYYYGNEQENWGVFVDDSWAVSDRLTMNLGLRFDHAKGIIPSYPILDTGRQTTGTSAPGLDPAFTWNNWSPRVGFAYNLGAARNTVIRGAFGVYYEGVIGGAFNGPPPYTPTMFYSTGPSWSGPWDFQGIWFSDNLTSAVDPDLRAPRTLQYSFGFEREFKGVYSFGAMIVYKDSKDAIGWEILDDGVYETFDWTDPFNDHTYTLLNPIEFPTIRKGNGPGFTVEGQLDRYWAEYTGLVLTFNRRLSDWWGLQASYTYSESKGLSVEPMLPWGQRGTLFNSKVGSHPNQWLNLADGQQQLGDRPHMFRVQATWLLPWNLHASTMINLQSGRPFTRQAREFSYNTISFDQTNFIAAPAGGPRRFDFQRLIDFNIGKRWQLQGRFILKTDLQIFNLLNNTAVDRWADQVLNEGDEFIPSLWVRPRRLMLRLGLEY